MRSYNYNPLSMININEETDERVFHIITWKASISSATILTRLTTLPTIARKIWGTNHILNIICAFSESRPPLAVHMLIRAISSSHYLIKRVYMNPLGCWPFFTLNYWASCMETIGVWDSIRVETEEQKSIPFTRFRCSFTWWSWKEKPVI